MKPVDFDLHQPVTVAETADLLASYGDDAKVLAGGQSLIPLLNFRLARPEHVIDIGRVGGLCAVTVTGPEVVIGAMVPTPPPNCPRSRRHWTRRSWRRTPAAPG